MFSLGELFASWVFLSLAERELKKISRKIEKEEKSEVKRQQRYLDKAHKRYIKSIDKLNRKN